MRILYILENYYPNIGGVETLFKSLAESMADKGHQITVLTNRFDPGLKKNEHLNGVAIKRLPFRNRYLFTFFAGFKALSLSRHHDLIHTTSYNAALPAFFAKFLSGKISIITFHEVWGRLWFSLPYMNKMALWLHYIFEAFILKLPFDRFIAVSDNTASALKQSGISSRRITRIYNGIDYSQFQSSDEERKRNDLFRFCYFGRLGISKGLDIILDAVEIMSLKEKGFRFLLIIPRKPTGFLKNLLATIERRGLNAYFEIKHELDFESLKSEIYKSDAVVIPSYSEGFCYAAVEAIALGTPVISSGRAALKETVSGKHLVMNGLNGQALADCMLDAMQDKWLLKPIHRFELSEAVDAYIELYHQPLSDR